MPDVLNDGQLEDRVIVRDPSLAVPQVVRLEPSPRHVRAAFGGVTVVDSKRAQLLLEPKHLPVYYFPSDDVRMDLLRPMDRRRHDEGKGEATFFTLVVGGVEIPSAAWTYSSVVEGAPPLKGLIAFYWNRLDAWYEEDDEVFVHPRDPYHRVDVLNSSRQVQVRLLGELVAETRRPRLLFETHLPTRYYIPKADVRMDMLRPSETTSRCPYKGIATYWSVQVGDMLAHDVAWAYEFPIPECPKIEGLVCFFNERVDELVVDGDRVPKPKTVWARPPRITRVG